MLGNDKVLHILGCTWIAFVTYFVLMKVGVDSQFIAWGFAMMVGIAKEVCDAKADWYDLLADFIGASTIFLI